MRIILVGFMGSGKSTIGKLLSERLFLPFLDLDEEILKRTGMTIPTIFSKFGEDTFRELERETLLELLSAKECIISTGGGAPVYKDNMDKINESAVSVYLKAEFETLWDRISKDSNRPLVSLGKEKVRELFEKRKPFYEKAKIKVRTDIYSPSETVDKILQELKLL
ncbi:MAG: shikimate kinase [Desulfurobacteriaceae bacterium]